MKFLPINRILRLALAISVSLWMAGAGCLFGCSNATFASSSDSVESADTVVAHDSCASSGSHDCCAKKNAHHPTTTANNVGDEVDASEHVRPIETAMNESCPMAVNASAIVSQGRAEISKASVAKTVQAPLPSTSVASHLRGTERRSLYNRGPTYLRCCVFLI